MPTYSLHSDASPDRVWHLLASPEHWPEWAPHIRHSVGFGPGPVAPGRWGLLFVGGVLPVGAFISEVSPGESWAFQLGALTVNHRVEREGDGSLIAVDFSGPLPVKALLQAFYAPLLSEALLNLSRLASE